MPRDSRPNSRRNLDIALDREFGGAGAAHAARTAMANAIVGQMLPNGAIKGGSALKLRFGYAETRYTADLDTVRAGDLDAYVSDLGASLAEGWEGFTGKVVPRQPAHPEGVPDGYVMRPFDVKLSYNGKSWVTVPLEVGHEEVGDAADPDWGISPSVAELFTRLGFPEPRPLPLLPLPHQVAQKLHALTSPGSDRARDLVDLQLIANRGDLDLAATREACERLFRSRDAQAWPPEVVVGEGWAEAYSGVALGLDVRQDVREAAEWANDLVGRIREA